MHRTVDFSVRFTSTLLALGLAAGFAACSTDTQPPGDATSTVDTGGGDTVNPDISIDIDFEDNKADTAVDKDTEKQDGGTIGAKCTQPEDCGGVKLNSCEVAACVAGECKAVTAPSGTTCDDKKVCTQNDVCNGAGDCAGVIQCEDKGPCVNPICTPQGDCSYTNVPPGLNKPCDDDNKCTIDDACAFGKCQGSQQPIGACNDNNSCTDDTCDAATGCVYTPSDKGKACTNGDLCISEPTCDGLSECKGGTAVTCDDGKACTKDECDSVKGCVFATKQDGQTCDDGSKCTEDDECVAGLCKGTKIAAAVPSNACKNVNCDGATGEVKISDASEGTSCDDSDPCTQQDSCTKGSCKGASLICNDGNPCTIDTCDPATGSCKSAPIKNGDVCSDGNACTSKDACVEGKCTGEDYTVSKACEDNNPCTNDGCAPQTGCFAVPKNSGVCEDGNKCTEQDNCVTGTCIGKAKVCQDNNPCTNDGCDAGSGACTSSAFDGPCNDGNNCTANDNCTGGKCEGKIKDCDDKNPCTNDVCDTIAGCKNLPKLGGTACDDGVGCTTGDKCDGGQCVGKNDCVACSSDIQCAPLSDNNICTGTIKCIDTTKGKVCDIDKKTIIQCPAPLDPACGTSLCDGQTGKCSVKDKAEGTPCNSANKCIEQTACSASGTCAGKTVDCDDDNDCTVDSCEPSKGCLHAAKADKEKCDDGNQCTPDELCDGGACIASKNLCACKADGECTKWDDGDLCNGLFACVAGFCGKKPNSLVTCEAGKDACKINACDKTKGSCALAPKKDGTSCDDSNQCSIQETCKLGECASTAKLDCSDNNPCTFDVCDKAFGCFNAPVGAGGPCDDGNGCTQADKCTKDGACAGTKLNCDDGNPCTIDVCDAKTGKCNALLENGIKCDDGDPCTSDDACKDGVCLASVLKCDDGNPCTIDGCDGKGGCKNVLEPNKDCNDGNACTTLDRCGVDGKCVGKAKDCSDGNACTTEACDKGVCVVNPDIDKPCNDSNACTEKDRCDKKGDCIADLIKCDDDNPCTKVAGPCSTVNGCTIVPNDGISCNDGSLCTIADKCAGGACSGIKLPCDDGNVCTNDSCNPAKGCVNEQNTCDDGNDCTFDKCDKAKGCISDKLDGFQPCDDGDKCTDKGVCKGTQCELQIVVCDDKQVCTLDKCDSKEGCVYLPSESTTTLCNDDSLCTDGLCDGKGECVGTAKKCDDGNPCTQDSCDKLKGCVTDDLKDATPCDDGDECSQKTVCQGGFCSGGNYDKCPACPNGLDKDCAIYDDNDLCNGKLVCKKKNPKDQGGLCYSVPEKVVCDTTADTPCIKNVCDPASGTCGVKEKVNGSACDDGVPCTVGDTCKNGSCASGAPADCSGVANACNTAGCVLDPTEPKGYGCVALPKTGTVTCDADGSGCTAQDTCAKGICKAGEAVDCSAVAKECELAACVKDGANGFTCKITAMKDGDACTDGQLCTVGDGCKAGKCQPGPGIFDCKDQIDATCAIPTCEKAQNGGFGGCTGKPQNEGKVCNADENGCTVNDICSSGFCVPGAPVSCIDKTTPCTTGACKSTGGLSYTCIAAPVNESKPCESDNNGCTLDDHCTAGKCVPGKLMDCAKLDSNGGCLIGACEPLSASQGKCVAKSAQIGLPCNADDNGCTKGDACNKDGACSPGAAVNCIAQASSCASGACTSTGKDAFKCVGDPKADGTKCDLDGNGCTVGDVCKAGDCKVGATPDCSKEDKSVCVVGGCTTKGSFTYICEPYAKKDGEVCDADKNGCTVNDACFKGFCESGKLETCKEFQGPCASAACEDKGGTSFQCKVTVAESYPPLVEAVICDPAAKPGEKGACATHYNCSVGKTGDTEGVCTPVVTVTCSDGDSCTVEDSCSDGKCVGGAPPDCNDFKPCTLDFCSKGECKSQAIAGCATCLIEEFDNIEMPDWAISYTDKSFKIQYLNEGPEAAPQWVYSATWDGSGLAKDPDVGDPPSSLRLLYRKLYLDPGKAQTMMLRARGDMADTDCLRIFVDEATEAWSFCGQFHGIEKYLGKYIEIDLSKYAGRTIDIDVRFSAVIKKASKGAMIIDSIEVAGNCGPGCLGESFEGTNLALTGIETPVELRRPQSWRFETTASTYLSWLVTDKSGKSGTGSLVATHSGKPSSGKPETAKLIVPGLTPVAGSKLSFALKATDIGEAGCTKGDKLVVSISGNDVFQRCDELKEWAVQTIDMAAYVGKTVDVVFTVTSATTDAAKGTFQIDDVSMSGKCSWLCFTENFDASAKLDTFGALGSLTEEMVATKLKVEGGQSIANSKPYSMLVQADDKIPAKSQAYVASNNQVQPRVHAPVAGAAMTMMVNAVVNPDLCPPADVPPDQQVLEYPLALGFAHGLAGGKLEMVLGVPICKSSSGWEKVTVQLTKPQMGKWVAPMIRAERLAKLKTMTAYFDDIQIICK